MNASDRLALPAQCDVVVVGAGLAGLAAARTLSAAGVDACVLDSSDDVGGRVRTDVVDGFRLDRGFQLYNPAYPEGRRVFDYAALDLQPFVAGAEIVLGTKHIRLADPRRQPSWILDSLTAPVGSLIGEMRFGAYALSRSLRSPATLRCAPDVTTEEALRAAGVGEELLDRFLRPFLSGVFLESELTTSRRYADLVLRSFVRGTPSVPAEGMGALPRDLVRGIDAPLHLRTAVTEVRGSGVRTSRGSIATRAVVVATDPATAAQLLPGLNLPAGHAVTTWYYRPDVPGAQLSSGDGVLLLDGFGRGPLVNAVVMSNAAPSYAPQGQALVSCSILGHDDSAGAEQAAREHLGRLLATDTSRWDLIGHYRIPFALPAMPAGTPLRKPVRLGDGVYVAGDHRDTPSIQGALVSGRRAAEAVLADLGAARRSPHDVGSPDHVGSAAHAGSPHTSDGLDGGDHR